MPFTENDPTEIFFALPSIRGGLGLFIRDMMLREKLLTKIESFPLYLKYELAYKDIYKLLFILSENDPRNLNEY